MILGWSFLGRAAYAPVLALQEALRSRILLHDFAAERLLFCEHPPVVTLGRSADPAHVLVPPAELAARGVELARTSRGGDVTVHGPGQLMIYPVMRLPRGVVAFVEAIGGALVDELAARGVTAGWRRAPAGVWVGDRKIAACGLHVRRRVAIHGFALNVAAVALAPFQMIVPCGLPGAEVTSIETETGSAPSLGELALALAGRIARSFGRRAEPIASEI